MALVIVRVARDGRRTGEGPPMRHGRFYGWAIMTGCALSGIGWVLAAAAVLWWFVMSVLSSS